MLHPTLVPAPRHAEACEVLDALGAPDSAVSSALDGDACALPSLVPTARLLAVNRSTAAVQTHGDMGESSSPRSSSPSTVSASLSTIVNRPKLK
jgi:hypothetical protein